MRLYLGEQSHEDFSQMALKKETWSVKGDTKSQKGMVRRTEKAMTQATVMLVSIPRNHCQASSRRLRWSVWTGSK